MGYLTDEYDMEKLTAPITVKFTTRQKEVLERLAIHSGVTVSDMLRESAIKMVNEKHLEHLSLANIFADLPPSDND